MSKLNDDMWEQIELNNYGKGKLVHIVNEQAELIRSLYEQLDSAHREGWEQCQREAVEIANNLFKYESGYYHYKEDVGDAIAAMEYKEADND